MEKSYWLGRKRASLKLARDAASSEARLAHYDLAGRYSVKASEAATQAIDLAGALPGPVDPIRSGPRVKSVDDA